MTRTITAALAIALALASLAAFANRGNGGAVRGAAARAGMMTQQSFSYKNYEQSGLIAMWDAENNNGAFSHSATTTKWKNLGTGGTAYDATASLVSWYDNYVEYPSKSMSRVFSVPSSIWAAMSGEWSVECVFMPYGDSKTRYSGIFGNHGGSGHELIGFQWDSSYGLSIFNASYTLWTATNSDFPNNVIQSVSASVSASALSSSVYQKGVLKSRKSASSASTLTLNCSRAFYIGSAYNDSNRPFVGRIYCLRIYNRALTAAEIAHNYEVDKRRFNLP